MPWEYEEYAYKCLCEDCHKNRATLELDLQKVISNLSDGDLDLLRCDVIYAVVMHGMKKVSDYCRELGV